MQRAREPVSVRLRGPVIPGASPLGSRRGADSAFPRPPGRRPRDPGLLPARPSRPAPSVGARRPRAGSGAAGTHLLDVLPHLRTVVADHQQLQSVIHEPVLRGQGEPSVRDRLRGKAPRPLPRPQLLPPPPMLGRGARERGKGGPGAGRAQSPSVTVLPTPRPPRSAGPPEGARARPLPGRRPPETGAPRLGRAPPARAREAARGVDSGKPDTGRPRRDPGRSGLPAPDAGEPPGCPGSPRVRGARPVPSAARPHRPAGRAARAPRALTMMSAPARPSDPSGGARRAPTPPPQRQRAEPPAAAAPRLPTNPRPRSAGNSVSAVPPLPLTSFRLRPRQGRRSSRSGSAHQFWGGEMQLLRPPTKRVLMQRSAPGGSTY